MGSLLADLEEMVFAPHRGSDISVFLADGTEDLADGTEDPDRMTVVRAVPSSPAGYFADVALVLPFEDYREIYFGTFRTDQFGVHPPVVVEQIKHILGGHLERLSRYGNIYLTARMLGYKNERVTPEFCAGLRSPRLPSNFDCIDDPWLHELFRKFNDVSRQLDRELQRLEGPVPYQ